MALSRLRNPNAEAIFRSFQDGDSLGILAQRHGVSRQRIDQIINAVAGATGEPRRPRGPTRHLIPPPLSLPLDIQVQYLAGFLTQPEIAAQLGLSLFAVGKAIQRLGLARPRRDHFAQAAYALFKQGWTIRQISKHFGKSMVSVGVALCRARKSDPHPYYRYAGCRPEE